MGACDSWRGGLLKEQDPCATSWTHGALQLRLPWSSPLLTCGPSSNSSTQTWKRKSLQSFARVDGGSLIALACSCANGQCNIQSSSIKRTCYFSLSALAKVHEMLKGFFAPSENHLWNSLCSFRLGSGLAHSAANMHSLRRPSLKAARGWKALRDRLTWPSWCISLSRN